MEALTGAMHKGLVRACHDCSDGGIGVSLAEMAFAGGLGMAIDLKAVPAEGISRDDELLFAESQSRFVVTIAPAAQAAFEAKLAGCVLACIGRVIPEGLFRIDGLAGERIVEEEITALKAAWQRPLAGL